MFLSYADDGVDLPLGPVNFVVEERDGERVLDVFCAMHDHVVVQTIVRHSMDRVGTRVNPVQTLHVEVQREPVRPAATCHSLDVEQVSAVLAAHARSLDARPRRLPVRPKHEAATKQEKET